MTRFISQTCSESIIDNKPLRIRDEEKMRERYLNWWSHDFEYVKNKIFKIVNEFEINKNEKIKLDNSQKEIYTNFGVINTDKSIITLGRHENCDIVLDENNTNISRIQCAIIFSVDKIYILDFWSLYGAETINRGIKSKELKKSIPKNRHIIDFEINETFEINFKGDKLIIGKKECIICFDNPKSVRFNCGHTICDNCSKKINDCPFCRRKINKRSFSQCVSLAS